MIKYEEKQILDEIKEVIDRYYAESTNCSPELILEMEDKLSAFAYYLAEYIYEKRKELSDAEVVRKVFEARSVVSYMTADYSAPIAAKKAILANESKFRKERTLYAAVHGLKPILDRAVTVLEMMRSRISWAKEEKKLSAYIQNSNDEKQ